jgi:hypothetical protein
MTPCFVHLSRARTRELAKSDQRDAGLHGAFFLHDEERKRLAAGITVSTWE